MYELKESTSASKKMSSKNLITKRGYSMYDNHKLFSIQRDELKSSIIYGLNN